MRFRWVWGRRTWAVDPIRKSQTEGRPRLAQAMENATKIRISGTKRLAVRGARNMGLDQDFRIRFCLIGAVDCSVPMSPKTAWWGVSLASAESCHIVYRDSIFREPHHHLR